MNVYLYICLCTYTHRYTVLHIQFQLYQKFHSAQNLKYIHATLKKYVSIYARDQIPPIIIYLKNMHMHIYAYIHTSKILKHGNSHQEWHGNTCIVFVYIHIYVYIYFRVQTCGCK